MNKAPRIDNIESDVALSPDWIRETVSAYLSSRILVVIPLASTSWHV